MELRSSILFFAILGEEPIVYQSAKPFLSPQNRSENKKVIAILKQVIWFFH